MGFQEPVNVLPKEPFASLLGGLLKVLVKGPHGLPDTGISLGHQTTQPDKLAVCLPCQSHHLLPVQRLRAASQHLPLALHLHQGGG